MKILTIFIVTLFSLFCFAANDGSSLNTEIATNAKKTKKSNAVTNQQTSHNFEDLLVQGQYHFSNEAVTTVEEDKVLDSLIGVRMDFKDKIEKSASKY